MVSPWMSQGTLMEYLGKAGEFIDHQNLVRISIWRGNTHLTISRLLMSPLVLAICIASHLLMVIYMEYVSKMRLIDMDAESCTVECVY